MKGLHRAVLFVISSVLMLTVITACGSAGGRRASDWNGTWYREGDAPSARCYAEIKNANKEGFDFTITVYNGNKAGELKDCHAAFNGETAYYYAEDPRSYIEFFFDYSDDSKLNIIFTTTGEAVEWTAFEGFRENAYITGIFSREESYVNSSLYEMGILSQKTDSVLQRMMGDSVYFRLISCFQTYTSERSNTTGTNAPYEYGGQVHLHDGIGGTVYYGSMTDQQYAACVIAYDDGSVSAAVSLENGSVGYYSDNWVYDETQPYPILIWVENYTREQNGEFDLSSVS
ncbi:MAG: hypothetical protein ACI4IJ_04255 [Acutalibacteraceae bacterium]